ncbi:hypothetical protein L1278_003727 [Pontibacter sp. HSC-36F09]|nr:hypothetical protein [Pontibacter sp. HSC-36F09]
MLRPRRGDERTSVTAFNKFARYFGMLMTLIYVAAGVFLLLMDTEKYNLNMSDQARTIFGGILILYGLIRFIRAYQVNSKSRRDRQDD